MVKNEWDNLTAEQIADIEAKLALSKAKLQPQQVQPQQQPLPQVKPTLISKLFPQQQVGLGTAPVAPQESKILGNIPKKIAAMEIVKHLNKSVMATAGFMIGMFATLLAGVFGKTPMYLSAGIFIIAAGVFLAYNKKEMERLKFEYKI